MNFFWFERTNNFNIKELSEELEDNGFSGVLFTYSFFNDDYFVKIANAIDSNKKIKYMVAIRPYAISAQYLCMINNAFKKISKDRIVINIITGWVHDQEKSIGGIQGNVNDLSNNIDRSNYLIEYVKSLTSGIYDLILVDSTDPIGPGEGLFSNDFYDNCYRILTEEGILINQHESPYFEKYQKLINDKKKYHYLK